MNFNGTEYYYVRNGQGDITGLLDETGKQVVSYSYNSWGKLLSVDGDLKDTVGVKNPYRYRGYRYDSETGLYYLQSRYYNPELGRLINADDIAILEIGKGDLLSTNLFVYCNNNQINNSDPNGYYTVSVNWRTETVAWALDVAIKVIGVAISLSGAIETYALYQAGRVYLRENIKKAVRRTIFGALFANVDLALQVIDKFTKFGSPGKIIANAFDYIDGKWDGRIKFKIRYSHYR